MISLNRISIAECGMRNVRVGFGSVFRRTPQFLNRNLVLISVLLITLFVSSGEAELSPPPIFAFAEKLFEEGEYFRAVTEYQRFLFLFPDHPLSKEALMKIGLCYFHGGKWDQAFLFLRRVFEEYPEDERSLEALLFLGESRMQLGEYEGAIELYREMAERYRATPIGFKAEYSLGWAYLRRREWEQARSVFQAIHPESPHFLDAQWLSGMVSRGSELPQRSPRIAGVLSALIPGAGQIYAGEAVDGIISLGVNGGFLGAILASLRAGLGVAGGIAAFFEWGFYEGNIRSAALAARQFNRATQETFLKELEQRARSPFSYP
ncbi:MAG: tetratricopeptide repeat protein [Candidatus Tectomicrobia bacterium]|nr:tetratricopeptide repeat protein [Candidatus Tectomicrobia bacterium]